MEKLLFYVSCGSILKNMDDKLVTIETRKCLVCYEILKRPIYPISKNNWLKRKYCSLKCGGRLKNFKGDKVKYSGIHKWINLNFIKVGRCELCKLEKTTTWANISGLYLRKIRDWKELCYKCHRNYDLKRKVENKYSHEKQRKFRKY